MRNWNHLRLLLAALLAVVVRLPASHAGISNVQSVWRFDDTLANDVAGGGPVTATNFTVNAASFVNSSIFGQTARVSEPEQTMREAA